MTLVFVTAYSLVVTRVLIQDVDVRKHFGKGHSSTNHLPAPLQYSYFCIIR